MSLKGRVALVTGGTRGIGKGIALELAAAGATVYVTGRTKAPKEGGGDGVGGSLDETVEEMKAVGGVGVGVVCDHSKDEDVLALFKKIVDDVGRLDILVNNAYAAVTAIGKFRDEKFWEEPEWMWDCVNNVGLRNNYLCTYHAAKLLMVPRRSGLIVNVSSYGGLTYVFNAAYGIGKAAVDRMAADCGTELRPFGVAMVSLMPGAVRTEEIMAKIKSGEYGGGPAMEERFLRGETTQFPGRCIVELAKDPNLMRKSGKIVMTADFPDEYGIRDVDGSVPVNMRSLKAIVNVPGFKVPGLLKTIITWLVPSFVKIPKWMLHLISNKF